MSKGNIIIVEDESILALDIQLILQSLGFTVSALYNSGEDALSAIPSLQPDLILMDISLGGKLDGIETAKEILKRHDIPVIFLTGLSDEDSVLRARETRPYGFIYKPFDKRDLFANIETALYRSNLEKKLKTSEEQYRSLYQSMVDSFVRIDMDGKIIEFNDAYMQMLGYTAAELLNIHNDDITPEKWRSMEHAIIQNQIMARGYSDTYQKEYIRKDGSVFPIELRSYLTKDLSGKPSSMWAIISDISERKIKEDLLSESIERYKILSDLTMDSASCTTIDENGSLHREWITEKLLIAYGYTQEDLGSFDKWGQIIHPDDKIKYHDNLKILLQGNKVSVDLRVLTSTGEIRWINNTIFPKTDTQTGKITKLYSAVKDITDRKRAEEDRIKTQNQLLAALDQTPAGIMIADAPDIKIKLVNQAAADILLQSSMEQMNISAQNTQNINWSCYREDGSRYAVEEMPLVQTIQNGTTFRNVEMKVVRHDGSERWILVNGSPIRDENGKIISGIIVFPDITGLKKAEEAFLSSEKKFKETIELLPLGIYECDIAGQITFGNKCAYEYFRLTDDDFINGVNIFNLIIPEEIDKARQTVQNLMRGLPINHSEYTGLRSDGTTFPVEIHSSFFYNNGVPAGMRGILIDLSEKKKIEEELIKAHKLESVGVLAGGIAHDFNNILTAILGNISLVKMMTSAEDNRHSLLNDAEKAGFRARDLTQQLLTFSRGGAPIKENTNVAGIIRDSSDFVLRGSKSICQYSIPDDLWHIDADKGQISQVIQNLIINADQSMPKGGNIRVTAENCELSENIKTGLLPGKYVQIIIADEGIGIPEQHLSNIFDPYFTTKQSGSGLGLSICYSIIKNHNGYIDVVSVIGSGTAFTIYLPAIEKSASTSDMTAMHTIHNGSGRILIMDDDPMIHTFTSNLLHKFGYDVDSSYSGEEMLEKYADAAKQKKPYNCIIMDLTIPGKMGGKESIVKLLEIDPKAKAIVSSGYSNDPVMSEYGKYGFLGIIPKPFDASELLKIIKDLTSKP